MNTETNSVISGSLMDYKKMYQELPDIEKSEVKKFKGGNCSLLEKLIWTMHQLYSLTPPEMIPTLEKMGIMGRRYRRHYVQSELKGPYWKRYDKLRQNETNLMREMRSQQGESWLDQLKAIDFGGNENETHAR